MSSNRGHARVLNDFNNRATGFCRLAKCFRYKKTLFSYFQTMQARLAKGFIRFHQCHVHVVQCKGFYKCNS